MLLSLSISVTVLLNCRITEKLCLEGTSGSHLIWPAVQSQINSNYVA